MKKVDMIIKALHFYTMEGDGVGYKNDVAMIVDSGKILDFIKADKVDSEYSAEEVLDMKEHAIFPGFIDGHMHTACNVMRGLAQDTNNWMMFGLQPFDNVATDEAKDAGSELAISLRTPRS